MASGLDFTLDVDVIIEGIEDFAEYTDNQIEDTVNYYADIAKEEFVRQVEAQAENNVYPRFGRDTAHVIETEEEYLEYRLGDIDEVYAVEVKSAIDTLKIRRDALISETVVVDVETILSEDGCVMVTTSYNGQSRTNNEIVASETPDGGYSIYNGDYEYFETVDELKIAMDALAPLNEWEIRLLD